MRTPDEKPALLIVEDDEAAQRQLRWTFLAYDVHGVRSRSEAVEACRARTFPVVLLDLGLPGDADGSSEGLAALWKKPAVRVRYLGSSQASADRVINTGDVVEVPAAEAAAWIGAGLAVLTSDPIGSAPSSPGTTCWRCGGHTTVTIGECEFCRALL